MKSAPLLERVLHLLLIVFLLFLPCLSFAEEPATTNPTLPSSPPVLGGKEGGRGAMEFKAGEPNYVIQIADIIPTEPDPSPLPMAVSSPDDLPPDDPHLSWQWSLSQINAFGAWEITTGSEKIVVALLDSGIDLDHPELKDKIWTNPGEIPGNGTDDDGNNYVDDVHGWNFVDWGSEPQDDHGHGTFVAGVVAAETDNSILMAGVSWGVEIMVVKVHDREGIGAIHDLNGGIRYAAANGARIIHVSGFVKTSACSNAMQLPVNYAHSRGALVVAGSGDPKSENPVPLDAYQYPAALDHVVSVAATDCYDDRWSNSTYNDKVDVAAPGVAVRSFVPGEYSMWPWSSTGLAAAHVSGLAALIWSVNPHLTNDEVGEIITSTAIDLGEPGRDDYFGYGRIDAAAAVMTTTHYLEVEDTVLDFGRVCDHGIIPSRTITNPNTNSSTWHVMLTDDWLSISGPEGLTPSSATVSIDKSALANYGVYTAEITAISTMTKYEHSPIIIPAAAVYAQCRYLPLLFKDHGPD